MKYLGIVRKIGLYEDIDMKTFSVNEKIYGRVELKNNSLLWFLTTGFNIKKQNKDFKICPNSDINENELEFKYQRIQKLNKILKLII